MGKAKRKGGLSGVSRFVFESMKSDSASSDAPNASSKATPELGRHCLDHGDGDVHSKRRKGNDGLVLEEEKQSPKATWVKKYEAGGLAQHYTDISQVPEHLHKYFSQRYRFFSLYSESPGCLLDEEGWYSVTPELLANQIAERCRCDTILDAFCGVGGNAIAFAKTCQRVIALDTSPTRLALARHNAQIYGVADRIEFILGDYLSFAKSYSSLPNSSTTQNTPATRRIDVVFLSPPWGGPSYLSGSVDDLTGQNTISLTPDTPTPDEHPSYSLSSIQPVHGAQLFNITRRITKNVAYYVPRNTRLDEIGALLTDEDVATSETSPRITEKVEVEEEWMGNKLKALTCYFGGLVSGQEGLF